MALKPGPAGIRQPALEQVALSFSCSILQWPKLKKIWVKKAKNKSPLQVLQFCLCENLSNAQQVLSTAPAPNWLVPNLKVAVDVFFRTFFSGLGKVKEL